MDYGGGGEAEGFAAGGGVGDGGFLVWVVVVVVFGFGGGEGAFCGGGFGGEVFAGGVGGCCGCGDVLGAGEEVVQQAFAGLYHRAALDEARGFAHGAGLEAEVFDFLDAGAAEVVFVVFFFVFGDVEGVVVFWVGCCLHGCGAARFLTQRLVEVLLLLRGFDGWVCGVLVVAHS